MTMLWFGAPHGAPYEAEAPHMPTPVNALCAWCDERIGFHDDGLLIPHVGDESVTHQPYHYACHLRGIVGGVNHQRKHCTCCGGTEPPDPPELSRRLAAEAAVNHWNMHR